MRNLLRLIVLTALLGAPACSGDNASPVDASPVDVPAVDVPAVDVPAVDVPVVDVCCDAPTVDPGTNTDPGPVEPDFDVEAAARGFRLYYRERAERALTAYNRFMVAGDADFGVTFGTVAVAREGEHYEVVPGPHDNNLIGMTAFTVWQAYKLYRSRPFAVAAARLFRGIAFLEAVSGHPGMTGRMVYPGWTRVVDGVAGTVSRTRNGAPAASPWSAPEGMESEVLQLFCKFLDIMAVRGA